MSWMVAETSSKKHTTGTSVLFVKTAVDAQMFLSQIQALHYHMRLSRAKLKKLTAEALAAVKNGEVLTYPLTDSESEFLRHPTTRKWIAEQQLKEATA